MPRLEDWLFDARPGMIGEILRSPFSALGLVYRAAAAARLAAYRKGLLKSHAAPIPVVSIGNLTVGGSGKTPAAIWLAQKLREQGWKPALSSRGYGSSGENDLLVIRSGDCPDPGRAGDEACLMAKKLAGVPVIVGKSRVNAAKKARELGADILILDDGLQHLKLKREVDIVLVDGKRPLGAERVFPRGRLREPLSALKRAHAVMVTRSEGQAGETISAINRINPGAPVFKMRYRVINPDALSGRRAFAFAGIADPAYFFETALSCKIALVGERAFSDHHYFSAQELKQLERSARAKGAEMLLTTEKDLARMGELKPDMPVRALEIEPDFFGQEDEILGLVIGKAKGKNV